MNFINLQISLDQGLLVVFRTTLIFIYAFILLRFLGRRKLSHLTYVDLLLIIAFGSAVGDVMIYAESVARFIHSFIALTVVSVLVKIMDEFASHSLIFNRFIDGEATLLISNGKVVKGILEKADLTEASLLSLLREKGVDSVSKVRKAFIEPDGEVSVILY